METTDEHRTIRLVRRANHLRQLTLHRLITMATRQPAAAMIDHHGPPGPGGSGWRRYIEMVTVGPTGDPIVTYTVGQGMCSAVVDYSTEPPTTLSQETEEGICPDQVLAVDVSPTGDRITVRTQDGARAATADVERADGSSFSIPIGVALIGAPTLDIDHGVAVIAGPLAPADPIGGPITVIDLATGTVVDLDAVGVATIGPPSTD